MNLQRCHEVYNIILHNPGIRPFQVAEKLGVNRYTAWRSILTMEFQGFLLAEDDSGGLYAVCVDAPRRDPSACRQTILKRRKHDDQIKSVVSG